MEFVSLYAVELSSIMHESACIDRPPPQTMTSSTLARRNHNAPTGSACPHSDTHWQALAAQWNNSQLLDFLFTVGTYVLLAGVMRSTGVEREPELLELAEKYGAPA
jgi:hypothetical protein